jgi:hypothetical protein
MPERVRVGPERWPSDRNNEQWVATEPLAHEAPPPENATDRPRFGRLLTGASQQASRALAWLTRFDRSCKRLTRPWPRLSSRGSSSDGCAADAERGASASPRCERVRPRLGATAFVLARAWAGLSQWRRSASPDRARSAPRRTIGFAQMQASSQYPLRRSHGTGSRTTTPPERRVPHRQSLRKSRATSVLRCASCARAGGGGSRHRETAFATERVARGVPAAPSYAGIAGRCRRASRSRERVSR